MGQTNRISQTGLDLIKSFEGLRRRSSKLAKGGWIVGYGHTRSAREGIEVSEREAEYLLRYDLQETERLVSDSVRAPLHQNEFDALVSLAWNIGEDAFRHSDVLKYVNSGEMLAAAESFGAWRKARVDGQLIVLDALVRRRAAEKNLFLTHPAGAPAAPSLVIRPELDSAASVLALSNGALSLENRITEEKKAAALLPAADPELNAANSNSQAETAVEETAAPVETTDDDSEPEIDPDDIEATTAEIGNRVRAEASIWDASDAVAYDDLEDYDDVEDDAEDDGIDDTLLAAAIAASNLSRRDDEAVEEDDGAEPQAVLSDLVDLEDAEEDAPLAEPDMLPDLEVADEAVEDASEEVEAIVVADDAEDEEPMSLLDEAEEAETEEAVSEAEVVETEETETPFFESETDEVTETALDDAEADENDDDAPLITSLDEDEAEIVSVEADEVSEEEASEATELSETTVVETETLSETIEDAADFDDEPETILESTEAVEEEVVAISEDTIEEAQADAPQALISEETVAEAAEGQIWQDEETVQETVEVIETAEAVDYVADDEEARRVTIVDPMVSDHYPGEDNGVDADAVHAPISGGRKSAGDFWFGVFPFILLALLGAAMAAFGVYDWLGNIRSEEPVAENQLYFGPFLTLIGGFGLIFGVYFMIRKLSGVED